MVLLSIFCSIGWQVRVPTNIIMRRQNVGGRWTLMIDSDGHTGDLTNLIGCLLTDQKAFQVSSVLVLARCPPFPIDVVFNTTDLARCLFLSQ